MKRLPQRLDYNTELETKSQSSVSTPHAAHFMAVLHHGANLNRLVLLSPITYCHVAQECNVIFWNHIFFFLFSSTKDGRWVATLFFSHSGSINLLTPGRLSRNCVTFVRHKKNCTFLSIWKNRDFFLGKSEWEGTSVIHSAAFKGSSLSYHSTEWCTWRFLSFSEVSQLE